MRTEALPMGRFLIILSMFLVASSVATAGRFRFPLKEGPQAEVVYQRLQLTGIAVAAVVELALPIATNWQGTPVLAYTAAALHLTSLAIYRIKLPAIQGIRPGTTDSHSVREQDLRRTHWPYQAIFAAAYVFLLIYLFTIVRNYF